MAHSHQNPLIYCRIRIKHSDNYVFIGTKLSIGDRNVYWILPKCLKDTPYVVYCRTLRPCFDVVIKKRDASYSKMPPLAEEKKLLQLKVCYGYAPFASIFNNIIRYIKRFVLRHIRAPCALIDLQQDTNRKLIYH